MSAPVIEFSNVSKAYRLGDHRFSLRDAFSKKLNTLSRSSKKEQESIFWALKNVDFAVQRGDILGLVGPNGAGKTTTLKLLSNITYPTNGSVKVNGKVSALIELGAGFHPDLTGRENVFLNAAILGIPLGEVRRKFDEIVAFAELEKFIDTPVKRYSSGMYVRLGFAVASHVDSEILLVDEVLAVGDAAFRKKCLKRIEDLRAKGTTILFVSHNLYMVQSVCTSGIFLLHGEVQSQGEINSTINAYEQWMREQQIKVTRDSMSEKIKTQPGIVEITHVDVKMVGQNNGASGDLLDYNCPAEVRVQYQAKTPIRRPNLYFKILQIDGNPCCMVRTADFGYTLDDIYGDGTIVVTLDPLQLAPGAYIVDAELLEDQDFVVLSQRHSDWFQVEGSRVGHEGVFVPHVSGARIEN